MGVNVETVLGYLYNQVGDLRCGCDFGWRGAHGPMVGARMWLPTFRELKPKITICA
jgi:hypothetical protein